MAAAVAAAAAAAPSGAAAPKAAASLESAGVKGPKVPPLPRPAKLAASEGGWRKFGLHPALVEALVVRKAFLGPTPIQVGDYYSTHVSIRLGRQP